MHITQLRSGLSQLSWRRFEISNHPQIAGGICSWCSRPVRTLPLSHAVACACIQQLGVKAKLQGTPRPDEISPLEISAPQLLITCMRSASAIYDPTMNYQETQLHLNPLHRLLADSHSPAISYYSDASDDFGGDMSTPADDDGSSVPLPQLGPNGGQMEHVGAGASSDAHLSARSAAAPTSAAAADMPVAMDVSTPQDGTADNLRESAEPAETPNFLRQRINGSGAVNSAASEGRQREGEINVRCQNALGRTSRVTQRVLGALF